VNCQFIWMASAFGMSATPPILGDSRPYAVLQSTLDEDCRQAEELKELVDEASRFHLGRQRRHSTVICSGALLFSSRVLRPSLVTLCSHKSGQCAVELYHASHLWYPPFYTSPMASSALQHWTASPTKEGCQPLKSWWRKSSNMTVGQSSLISLAHHCYDWHPESRCG